MLKSLIKNELFQLNCYFVYDRKKNAMRSKKSLFWFIALIVFLFLCFAVAFFGMDQLFAEAFINSDLEWAFFSMTGMIAIVLGVFGDILNSYNMLYKSKDNDLLLSMPITPAKILYAKMFSISVMGFAYASVVFIPAMVTYWIVKNKITFATILYPIITWLFIGLFVVVITCLLGWIIAFISSKIRAKNFTKVFATLAILTVYYIFYFKAMNNLENVLTNREHIADVISGWLYPFYKMGLGASGSILSLLIFVGMVSALFALTYYLMSRSYIKMVTSNKGAKKAEYKKQASKKASVTSALLRKELNRFTGSSTYMLNSGIGLIISLAVAVFLFIKAPMIKELVAVIPTIAEQIPWISQAVPVVGAIAPLFIVTMNAISAPSVSLEGNSIWVLQCSPVAPEKVMYAKVVNHIRLCIVPTVAFAVAVAYVLSLGLLNGILTTLFCVTYMVFIGVLGVLLDFVKGNLNWTNEVYPIKQSFSVTLIILGGWGVILIIAGLFFLLRNIISGPLFLVVWIVIMVAVTMWFTKILKIKARAEFSYLK